MTKQRALAGTREGARPCPLCGHMMLRHLNRGTGRCSDSHVVTYTDDRGRDVRQTVPCPCPGTEPELEN